MKAAPICRGSELLASGRGIRFLVKHKSRIFPAFVIRYRGRVHAFLNQCRHQTLELDWNEGDFFDLEGNHIICATHGACYDPSTGLCVTGPCAGARLTALQVSETQGVVYLIDEDYFLASSKPSAGQSKS